MNEFSFRTAIRRNSMSLPCKYLLTHNLIAGRVLDYGSGYGYDAMALNKVGYKCDMYDPHFTPAKPTGIYDTILCTYVLNVLFHREREEVIENLRSYMDEDTNCFIAVRRDFPTRETFLVHTALDTFQFYVELPYEIIYENAKFCIYQLPMS